MPKSIAAIMAANAARIEFINQNPKLTIREIAQELKISYIKSWRLVHGYEGRRLVRKSKLPYKPERAEKRQIVQKKAKNMFNLKERNNWMV